MVNDKRKVYRTLDAWRGVAALWVVMFHVMISTLDKHPGIRSGNCYRLSDHGAFGVWMFFVISGYCIANAACQNVTKKHIGIRGYAEARLRRIFPTFWASSVLYLAYSAIASMLVAHGVFQVSNHTSESVLHQTPLYYLTNLTLTQRLFHQDSLQAVYWTLCYEVTFYVLVAFGLMLALRQGGETRLLGILHGLTVISLLLLVISPKATFYPLDLWPYFGLGVVVYDLVQFSYRRTAIVAAIAIAIEVLWFDFQHPHIAGYVDIGGGPSLLFTLGFAFLLLVLHPYDDRLNSVRLFKSLAKIGLFSYSLYLTHFPIVSIMYKVFERGGKAGSLYGVCLIVSMIAAVVFARFFYQFFERPFIGWGRKTQLEQLHYVNPITINPAMTEKSR